MQLKSTRSSQFRNIKIRILVLSVVSVYATGCATLRDWNARVHGRNRVLLGAGRGGAAGALGGSALSPYDENRGLNTLVFGLTGAVVGALSGLLTDIVPEPRPEDRSIKAKEIDLGATTRREFVIPNNQKLPDFVKKRIRPAIVEEYIETDALSEDGALSEPHKVYRIKQPTELTARPVEAGEP
jgi:hypothetical protein